MEQVAKRTNLNQKFVLERLFIGLIEEMTGISTIDSYRAKSTSSRSVLAELYQVLNDWKDKKIKSPDTVMAIRDEVVSLLEEDEHMKYGKINKDFFKDVLKELKSDGKLINVDAVNKCEYNLYYLLVLNAEYLKSIISGIEKVLSSEYYEIAEFVVAQKTLNKFCNALVSELLNSGYSKVFIRAFMKSEFTKSNPSNFKDRWERFKITFSNEKANDYIVVFKMFINVENVLEADFGQIKASIEGIREEFELNKNHNFTKFFEKVSLEHFIPLETTALDKFQAAIKARKQLSIILDIIHLIHPNSSQRIHGQAVVIDKERKSESSVVRHGVQNEGAKPNSDTYSKLISKLTQIKNNGAILEEVSDKLYACVKHLRLSNEADDLEQKFLNCWIGLENIFANYHTDASTFSRIKENLVNAHLVSYIKRNIHNFHRTVASSSIRKQVTLFDKENIEYLTDVATYNEIIALENFYPMIAYRARYLKSVLFNGNRRVAYIDKHKLNLERHLVRMYRIRNEIVHDAKSSYRLDTVYNNLRYYLTFTLSKCVDFFSDCQPKPIAQHKVSLDDFFYYQSSILNSMKRNEYKVDECIMVPHSVELFI
jgi:hypothetical protein